MHPIGIDLGTTFSAIARWRNQRTFVGSDPYTFSSEGRKTLASKVFFEEDDGKANVIVGRGAIASGQLRPDQYVSAVKRMMDDADYRYNVLGQEYSPIDISAEILKKMLQAVEAIEGPGTYVPKGVVVTVPYYFKQHQNLNTKSAMLKTLADLYGGRYSGNTDDLFLGMVAEPVAAGLDFAFNQEGRVSGDERFLVFDLGGGTFDVTIFSLSNQADTMRFEVLAVDGNDRLGGEDFDRVLLDFVLEEVGIDLDNEDEKTKSRSLKTILPAITEAKEKLATAQTCEIIVPNAVRAQNIELTVKRKDFEKRLQDGGRDFKNEVKQILENVLNKAQLRPDGITSLLLTGGSAKMLFFRELLEEMFGESKIRDMADLDLAVARGAAIYAAVMLDKKLEAQGKPREHLTLWKHVETIEPTAHSLGIITSRGVFWMISDNAITPAKRTVPLKPTGLSADGKTVTWSELTVVQGNKQDYTEVGMVKLPSIYTHGRTKEAIAARLTFTAEKNLIKVALDISQGNADRTDIHLTEDLMLGSS